MKKVIFSLLMVFALAGLAISQQPTVEKQETKEAEVVKAKGNKVAGLELPDDQTVNSDEGFVNIQAKCKGEVKWLVISNAKVKYFVVPQSNSLIVSIPNNTDLVTVFAVGVVDGKLTDFAMTNINISQGNNPTPNPTPTPTPTPTPNPQPTGTYHITFLVDMNNTTPELATLLNSENLRKAITSKGNFFRLYDMKSPIVQQKNLQGVVQRIGGNAIMVIQRNDGTIVAAQTAPRTDTEAIAIINAATGGAKK